jgi:DNA-binding transcriptional regulator GbsR (MarR family)
MEERKRREIEPTLSLLRQCVLELEADRDTPSETKARIAEMLSFMSTLTEWFDQVKALPKPTLVALMKMGGKIAQLVPKSIVRKLQSTGST